MLILSFAINKASNYLSIEASISGINPHSFKLGVTIDILIFQFYNHLITAIIFLPTIILQFPPATLHLHSHCSLSVVTPESRSA